MRRTMSPLFFPTLIALGVLLAPVASPAVAAPLRDDAGFFSLETKAKVNEKLAQIQKRDGKNVVVETHQSAPPSVPATGDARARSEAFEAWMKQRGKEVGADVMILVTRNPSHVEVASSSATRAAAFTAENNREVGNLLVEQFRQRRFDEGLVQAVDYIDRHLAQHAGAASRGGAAAGGGSRAAGGQSAPGYPPAPGSSGNQRPQAIPQVGCGGTLGSLLCMIVAIAGVVMLVRGVMARRSGYGAPGGPGQYGQQPGNYPPPPPGGYPPGGYGQPGYGQPGYGQPGGGFGRGVAGGLLGGLLGGWLMNRTTMGSPGALGGTDPNAANPQGLPPTDPSTFDAGGGDFGGSSDFGGGDFGGGGDSGGGDF
jgi:hypothetical protein